MQDLTVIFVFIIGLCFGSFANVLIHRIPRHESVVFPPSHCPYCTVDIPWWGNIPILSYLILRSRCHFCGAPISLRYPLVECLGGAIALLCLMKWGYSAESVLWFASLILLLSLSLIDLDTLILPDNLMIGLSACAIGFILLHPSLSVLVSRIGASFAGSGIVLLLILMSRGGMGFGDVKLVGVLGLLLGPAFLIVSFFSAIVIGACVALILLFTGKKKRKDPIPFGPFLAIGSFIGIFVGDSVIHWYRSNFQI